MILLKQLLIEELRNNGIAASIEPFRAVAEWDPAFRRFVFDGGTYAVLRTRVLSPTLKAKMRWEFVRAGESADQPIEVIELQSLRSPVGAQGQGLGRKALKQITDVADANNMWIMLEAIPFGPKSMNSWQLVEFYKSAGFEVISYGARPMMLRKPTQNDFSGVKDTL